MSDPLYDFQGRASTFSVTADGGSKFFVGRRVPYEDNIGLYNIFARTPLYQTQLRSRQLSDRIRLLGGLHRSHRGMRGTQLPDPQQLRPGRLHLRLRAIRGPRPQRRFREVFPRAAPASRGRGLFPDARASMAAGSRRSTARAPVALESDADHRAADEIPQSDAGRGRGPGGDRGGQVHPLDRHAAVPPGSRRSRRWSATYRGLHARAPTRAS